MHDYPPTYSSPRDVDLRRQARKPLFGLGRLVATPGALNILTTAQCHPVQLLQRHQHGDWCDPGELCTADKAANDHALLTGGRLLSVYRVDGIRLYVMTEAVNDGSERRDSTCILLPSEY
ncbi:type I restriction endonuclease subunit M [Acidovorax temperans]|uniref:type I restriction endonuclease subunit M n=1 Tax=Acidovorax temperans TaxID=80878 RepID=UPI001A945C3E|nr:type I restriction endonuclease subunit M [Acidovorax temperans]MBO0944016.1 type I restriction endonuclease subunit M [Acidovorax temperans]